MHTWIIFYSCNRFPVGFTFIHLCSGTTMYCYRFYTNVLKTFCNLNYFNRVMIPT